MRIRRTPSGAPDGHHISRNIELCISTTKYCNLNANQMRTYREHCAAARPRTTVLVTLLLASVPTQIPRTDRPAREECHKNHNWLKNPAPSHTYYTLEETYDVKSKKCDTIGINLGAAVGGGNPPHRPPPGEGGPSGAHDRKGHLVWALRLPYKAAPRQWYH